MSARCTGACCGVIKLWHGVTGERITLADVCAIVDRQYGDADTAKLKALLRPAPSEDDVHELACSAFVDGRCAVYVDRPQMCVDYPNNMYAGCRHCGAYSDQEARGVALMRTA